MASYRTMPYPLPRPRRPISGERREVAEHEARHVVYGIIHGVPIRFVEIDLHSIPEAGAGGSVTTDLDLLADLVVDDGRREVIIHYVAQLLVGYMGPRKWLPPEPEEWPPTWWDAWGISRESLDLRLRALDVRQEEYAEALVYADLFTLEPRYQEAVRVLAERLLEEQTIHRDRAIDIIAGVLGPEAIHAISGEPGVKEDG